MRELTPKKIVEELDRYIIGQDQAKKAVAVGLRNRYRRRKVSSEFRDEIKPKNILMVGPTGVGKTEIARRMSKLVNAPFIKIEATKFTEVGYVGRDVESMIRDLMEESIRIIKRERIADVKEKSEYLANERILDILIPREGQKHTNPFEALFATEEEEIKEDDGEIILKRENVREKLNSGKLDSELIEIEIEDRHSSTVGMFSDLGMEEYNFDMEGLFGNMLPKKTKKKKTTIREARKILSHEEAQKLVDMDEVIDKALKKTEEEGIIFLDEIDKIAGGSNDASKGPDVSREGVQRDILPIVEGTNVITKYGPINTEHILFIAAGAFHVSKVSDLIPEIQGRFPVRVELDKLTEENFIEILTKPENALTKQYQLLMETEGLELSFTDDAIKSIARMAYLSNDQMENIGARRLQTVLEKLLEDLSFNACDMADKEFVIDEDYVNEKLKIEGMQRDISKYIL